MHLLKLKCNNIFYVFFRFFFTSTWYLVHVLSNIGSYISHLILKLFANTLLRHLNTFYTILQVNLTFIFNIILWTMDIHVCKNYKTVNFKYQN